MSNLLSAPAPGTEPTATKKEGLSSPQPEPNSQDEISPELVAFCSPERLRKKRSNHDPVTSTDLLAEARDIRNGVAWERLIRFYTPLLYPWLQRFSLQLQGRTLQQQDADDLVQDVLGVLARELPAFQHNGRPGAFRSWLKKTLLNRVRTFLRDDRGRAKGTGDDQGAAVADRVDPDRVVVGATPFKDLDEHYDQDHRCFIVQRLLELLEPDFLHGRTWQVFHRLVVEGAKVETVAAEFQISRRQVNDAKYRARTRLQLAAQDLLKWLPLLDVEDLLG